MEAVWFYLKRFIDTRIYGKVIVPPKHCEGCGRALLRGQLVSPPFHAACAARRSK